MVVLIAEKLLQVVLTIFEANAKKNALPYIPISAGNSLEDVLNAPGTVYYVDDKGRLYLKQLGWKLSSAKRYRGTRKTAKPPISMLKPRFLYEQNGYFEQVGVKQLSNGHRYLAGKVPTTRPDEVGLQIYCFFFGFLDECNVYNVT